MTYSKHNGYFHTPETTHIDTVRKTLFGPQ